MGGGLWWDKDAAAPIHGMKAHSAGEDDSVASIWETQKVFGFYKRQLQLCRCKPSSVSLKLLAS